MPPNAKMSFQTISAPSRAESDILEETLDRLSDTNGLSKLDENAGDWTDVKHSERKKRDRLLKDKVLLELMQKSDYEGFKRLFENLAILALTIFAIYKMHMFPFSKENMTPANLAIFIPLYVFFGFQLQCFAFAGNHELLHGNAFKTRKYNNWVMFAVGVTCFEFGKHERLMHKQHHTYTNNIDKDPELTSFFSREELENANFRGVVYSRYYYLKGFFDVTFYFRCRTMRLLSAAFGKPIDYSGTGWSMRTDVYSPENVQDLKNTARLQLLIYLTIFALFGQTKEGLQGIFYWWIIPVIVGYAPINYFRNAEHADCEVSKDPNMLRNTRTVESNAVIRQLLWNTNFHVEHHCYPMVPFFNLPKLHVLMDDNIVHNECKHFTIQNWDYIRPGGWIDQQNSGAPIKSE
jgi:fatty acid desaturase